MGAQPERTIEKNVSYYILWLSLIIVLWFHSDFRGRVIAMDIGELLSYKVSISGKCIYAQLFVVWSKHIWFLLQPPIVPKRPLPESELAPRDSESEYDRHKKIRKLDKFREYEDPLLRDAKREEDQNVVKSEVEAADEGPSDAVQQLLDQDTAEV